MDRDQEVRLVAECQNGDIQALGALVSEYQRPVYNAVYRMLGNADEAEDVTQSAFLKAFEHIDRFDPQFRFFSWIYRIALNEAIDQLKREQRTRTLVDIPASDAAGPQDEAAKSEACGHVQSALMEIKEELRAVIVLRYFTECSYHQIGEILELPDKTVKSRLFTARQRLKRQLEQHGVFSA